MARSDTQGRYRSDILVKNLRIEHRKTFRYLIRYHLSNGSSWHVGREEKISGIDISIDRRYKLQYRTWKGCIETSSSYYTVMVTTRYCKNFWCFDNCWLLSVIHFCVLQTIKMSVCFLCVISAAGVEILSCTDYSLSCDVKKKKKHFLGMEQILPDLGEWQMDRRSRETECSVLNRTF